MLTQDVLKSLLDYSPDTGEFRWKGRGGSVAGCLKNGRRKIRVLGKEYYAYRLAFLFMEGALPLEDVDHINGDSTDDRWENIRSATTRQNCYNTGARSTSITGVKGVTPCRDKFRAAIGGRHLGVFETVSEASNAYREAARELHGEFCHASV